MWFAVTVRDQERWCLRGDPGEQAEVRGVIGNLADVAHSEQIRFEPERKEAGFDVVAGAGND